MSWLRGLLIQMGQGSSIPRMGPTGAQIEGLPDVGTGVQIAPSKTVTQRPKPMPAREQGGSFAIKSNAFGSVSRPVSNEGSGSQIGSALSQRRQMLQANPNAYVNDYNLFDYADWMTLAQYNSFYPPYGGVGDPMGGFGMNVDPLLDGGLGGTLGGGYSDPGLLDSNVGANAITDVVDTIACNIDDGTDFDSF